MSENIIMLRMTHALHVFHVTDDDRVFLDIVLFMPETQSLAYVFGDLVANGPTGKQTCPMQDLK